LSGQHNKNNINDDDGDNSFAGHHVQAHRGQIQSDENDRTHFNRTSITTFRPSVDLENLFFVTTTLRPPDPPVTTAFLQEPSPRTTPPPAMTTEAFVTVPLPNFEDEADNFINSDEREQRRGGGGSGRRRGGKIRRIGVNARFSDNFRPSPKAFDSPSDFTEDSSVGSIAKDVTTQRPRSKSVTEIVKVFLSDQKLFEQEFDYYDYYDDRKKRI
jgi:hypothetical protein